MLRFFRSIRKSLLESSHFRKYTVYAIGEILLVMIGILLALQVNNWNQNRLNNQEEERILDAIVKDMDNIVDYCNVCNLVQKQVIESGNRLLDGSAGGEGKPASDIDIQDVIKRCFVGEGLVNNIYDVLMSSDQLDLLDSRELRRRLGRLDAWIGTMIPYETLQAEYVDQQLKPVINRIMDRSLSEPESEIDELVADKEFKNTLLDHLSHTRSITIMYSRILSEVSYIDSLVIIERPELKSDILNRNKN